ncbi:hypothetical protein D3C81_1506980 [compost metagenome]
MLQGLERADGHIELHPGPEVVEGGGKQLLAGPEQLGSQAHAGAVERRIQGRPSTGRRADQGLGGHFYAVQLQTCVVTRIDQRQRADRKTFGRRRDQEQADTLLLAGLPGRARHHQVGIGAQPVDHESLLAVQAITRAFGCGS